MTTGVVTTSFPRHPGDFAGCFVEDAVHACVEEGQIVEVIAAGSTPADDETEAIAAGVSPPFDVTDFANGTQAATTARTAAARDRPDLGPAVHVLRIAMPVAGGAAPLFFGAGAPETLERGGASAWTQAFFFWAGLCERIRERSRSWDRVVAHWLVPCGLAAAAVAPHLPLTAYAHSGDVALLERIPGGAALGRQLARQTDDLIFVSADLRDRFVRLTGIAAGRVAPIVPAAKTVVTAPDLTTRQATRAALGLSGRVVLSVGRLVPIKGFDVLLRAVAIANAAGWPDRHAPATVVILGEGSERARLQNMAARLNINLRLPGLVPRPEVGRWMSGADLYVQPSRRLASGRTEGLPTATLEAVARGLPVIASATGGLVELARSHANRAIHLVPADDARALGTRLVDWASQLNAASAAKRVVSVAG